MALAWPKGTKFVGKVVRDSFKNVRRKNGESGDSMLSFRFDGVEVKGGAAVPIHGLVVAFSPSLASRPWIVPGSSLDRSWIVQDLVGPPSVCPAQSITATLQLRRGLDSDVRIEVELR
jgi:hypothetical protein